jgi:hypothetical protein
MTAELHQLRDTKKMRLYLLRAMTAATPEMGFLNGIFSQGF